MLDKVDIGDASPVEQLASEAECANVSPGFDEDHLHAVANPEYLEQVGDQSDNDTRSGAISRDDVGIVEAFSLFRVGAEFRTRTGRKSFKGGEGREKRGQPSGPERLVNIPCSSDLIGVPSTGMVSVKIRNPLLKPGHCEQRIAITGREDVAAVHVLGWAQRLADELHHLGSVAAGAQNVAEVSSRKATDVEGVGGRSATLLRRAGGLWHIVILQIVS